MLHKSSVRLNISKDSVFYGDSQCDEDCAKNYGLNFVKIVQNTYEQYAKN
jgi:hypothetical protein